MTRSIAERIAFLLFLLHSASGAGLRRHAQEGAPPAPSPVSLPAFETASPASSAMQVDATFRVALRYRSVGEMENAEDIEWFENSTETVFDQFYNAAEGSLTPETRGEVLGMKSEVTYISQELMDDGDGVPINRVVFDMQLMYLATAIAEPDPYAYIENAYTNAFLKGIYTVELRDNVLAFASLSLIGSPARVEVPAAPAVTPTTMPVATVSETIDTIYFDCTNVLELNITEQELFPEIIEKFLSDWYFASRRRLQIRTDLQDYDTQISFVSQSFETLPDSSTRNVIAIRQDVSYVVVAGRGNVPDAYAYFAAPFRNEIGKVLILELLRAQLNAFTAQSLLGVPSETEPSSSTSDTPAPVSSTTAPSGSPAAVTPATEVPTDNPFSLIPEVPTAATTGSPTLSPTTLTPSTSPTAAETTSSPVTPSPTAEPETLTPVNVTFDEVFFDFREINLMSTLAHKEFADLTREHFLDFYNRRRRRLQGVQRPSDILNVTTSIKFTSQSFKTTMEGGSISGITIQQELSYLARPSASNEPFDYVSLPYRDILGKQRYLALLDENMEAFTEESTLFRMQNGVPEEPSEDDDGFPWWIIVVGVIVFLVIVAAGFLAYRNQKETSAAAAAARKKKSPKETMADDTGDTHFTTAPSSPSKSASPTKRTASPTKRTVVPVVPVVEEKSLEPESNSEKDDMSFAHSYAKSIETSGFDYDQVGTPNERKMDSSVDTSLDGKGYADSDLDIEEDQFVIYAPAGKLGLVVDNPDDGAPVIHAIKSDSVLIDQIQVGDRLVGVDEIDVRTLSPVKVSKLISKRSSNPLRKLTLTRIKTAEDEYTMGQSSYAMSRMSQVDMDTIADSDEDTSHIGSMSRISADYDPMDTNASMSIDYPDDMSSQMPADISRDGSSRKPDP